VRSYFSLPDSDEGPAEATLDSFAGRYYVQMYAWKQPMSPGQFASLLGQFRVNRWTPTSRIAQETLNSPVAKKVIVWDTVPFKSLAVVDELGPELKGWRLVREDWYPVLLFWNWQEKTKFHRREYVKVGGVLDAPGKPGR
jgi:hypothetical protein